MEETIKVLEEFIKYFEAEAIQRQYSRNISITVGEDDIEAIETLLQAYKEDEKVIEEMALYIKNPYVVVTVGSSEQKIEIIKDYFRNKVREENNK